MAKSHGPDRETVVCSIAFGLTAESRPPVLIEKCVRGMDQKLGYHGEDRFVLFYYEPQGGEVIWRDSHSYGFSTGAGQLFLDELSPVADHHNVDVGSTGSRGTHVLLIDRSDHRAYFLETLEAIRFLTSVAEEQRKSDTNMPEEAAPPDSRKILVESRRDTAGRRSELWRHDCRRWLN